MSERISTLFVTTNDGGPTAYLTADEFPVTKNLPLTILLLDFVIGKQYELNISVTQDDKQIVVNPVKFKLTLDDNSKLTGNNSLGRMSSLINVDTSPINFIQENLEYEIALSIKLDGKETEKFETYIRTKKDNG